MAFDYSGYLQQQPRTQVINQYPYNGPNMDFEQEDPGIAAKENRRYMANWGSGMDSTIGNEQDRQYNLEARYRNPMDEAYGDLANNPGYSDEEMQNMLRTGGYEGGMMTPEEMAEIRGNPQNYGKYFNPDAMRGVSAGQDVLQRNALTEGRAGLATATGDLIKGYGAAIGPGLGVSQDYVNALGGSLAKGEGDIRASLNRDKLTLDPTLKDDYLMSDQELQGIQDKAARTAHLSRQGRYEDIQRRAIAGGNGDAMALAGLSREYEREADASAADASLNGYLSGRNEQAQRRMNLEQTRLDAERGYSGMATANYQTIADRGVGAANSAEQLRLGAARDVSDRQMDAEGDIANKRFNATQWGADQGVALEGGIADRTLGNERFITDYGGNLEQDMDNAQSSRASGLMNTRNSQNLDFQDRQADATKLGGDARISGQKQFRDWATDQTNVPGDRALAYSGQRINTGSAAMGNMNTATGQWADYDMKRRSSGFGAAFKNSLGESLGKTLGSPKFVV